MTDPARLFRIADRLADVATGSIEADRTIHAAFGRIGTPAPYTTEAMVADRLLPDGFEWLPLMYSAGAVYAACRRVGLDADGHRWPHIGQWGQTQPLAMCGAAVRTHAKLMKG